MSRLLPACLGGRNFRSRRGDRFDDWGVGHQFEPCYLNHPEGGVLTSWQTEKGLVATGVSSLTDKVWYKMESVGAR
jgi:hypothetical protein